MMLFSDSDTTVKVNEGQPGPGEYVVTYRICFPLRWRYAQLL